MASGASPTGHTRFTGGFQSEPEEQNVAKWEGRKVSYFADRFQKLSWLKATLVTLGSVGTVHIARGLSMRWKRTGGKVKERSIEATYLQQFYIGSRVKKPHDPTNRKMLGG